MTISLLEVFDIAGTIAFAISGSYVGIRRDMDIFGIMVLAVTTACGGGMIRDLVMGRIPPVMFMHPMFVLIAVITAAIVFIVAKRKRIFPRNMVSIYDHVMFWFDTFGLAAFTVDGVMAGINKGYSDHAFMMIFLGLITGVGGGLLRDVLAGQVPYIFVKHVYAVASIAGAACMTILYRMTGRWQLSMIVGAAVVVVLRFLASHFEWDLPKVN